ncbi:sulfotransferase family protein [Nonomuraea sp. NPDC050786]|uniref:sulfotransferase family protein n=1 Tax=Nonomuraea sp. NPDC050786 TaxID=3154840 RepID=UPI0033C39908
MLKVVGASYGRTGTSSVRLALEILGFGPCHYMRELFTSPAHAEEWLRVAEGGAPDWKRLLDGFASTIAWPAAFWWRELAAAFPEARVLLIVRDPASWYASMRRTLYRTRPAVAGPEASVRDQVIEKIVWQGTFSGRFEDRDHAIGVYLAHLDEVRDAVPPGRLIEVEPSRGWEPLCAALGVDVPDVPFPVANTTDDYLRRAEQAGVLPPR